MPTNEIANACATTRPQSDIRCATGCPGHGTTCNCPPLIVLAVLSAEQAALASGAAAGAGR